jgi:hypothetical protein
VFETGTDPLNPDTDGDGILDGREIPSTTTSEGEAEADLVTPEVPAGPGSDDGNPFFTIPAALAVAAGIAAAAGLGLTSAGGRLWASLLRFLGGTSFGLFLIGLFRRDKRPGPPIDFTIFTDGPLTHLAWSSPTTGGPAEKYVLEGRKDGRWGELLDFDAENTRAAVPTSEVEGAEAWRLRAVNDHGMGKPSDASLTDTPKRAGNDTPDET